MRISGDLGRGPGFSGAGLKVVLFNVPEREMSLGNGIADLLGVVVGIGVAALWTWRRQGS